MVWQENARCKGLSSDQIEELFFIKQGGSSRKGEEFCAECPVRQECLTEAILYDEKGIWAGTTDQDRDIISPTLKPLLLEAAIERGELKYFSSPLSAVPDEPIEPLPALYSWIDHDAV